MKLIKNKNKKIPIISCGTKNHKPIPESDFQNIKNYVDEIIFLMHGFYDVYDSIITLDKIPYMHPLYWDNLMDSTEPVRELGINFLYQTVLMKSNFDFFDDIVTTIWLDCNSLKKDMN